MPERRDNGKAGLNDEEYVELGLVSLDLRDELKMRKQWNVFKFANRNNLLKARKLERINYQCPKCKKYIKDLNKWPLHCKHCNNCGTQEIPYHSYPEDILQRCKYCGTQRKATVEYKGFKMCTKCAQYMEKCFDAFRKNSSV